jgi:hypothetical protein
MDELNNLLQPLNAPVTAEREGLGYDFDTTNERNSVNMTHIKNLSLDSLTAGTITTTIYLGGPNIVLDGANNRIIINDGTVDRILIGYLAGGF